MTKKRKMKKKGGAGNGFIGRLFAQTKLPAHVTEEQDWYLDTPDVRLTRVFTIVLILHVVAVGGILAFKMVEKASTPATVAATVDPVPEASESKPSTPPAESLPAEKAAPAVPAAPKKTEASKTGNDRAGLVMDHPSAPGYRQYRVAAGDTLVSIAREMKVSAANLMELNQLSKDTRLNPGRWLNIPGSPGGSAPPKPAPASAGRVAKVETEKAEKIPVPGTGIRPIGKTPAENRPAPAAGSSIYEVKKGDTFFGIAQQFGLNYKELMAANGIETPEGLQAGMTLTIPGN